MHKALWHRMVVLHGKPKRAVPAPRRLEVSLEHDLNLVEIQVRELRLQIAGRVYPGGATSVDAEEVIERPGHDHTGRLPALIVIGAREDGMERAPEVAALLVRYCRDPLDAPLLVKQYRRPMSDRLEAIAEAADDGNKVGIEPDTGAGQRGDAIEAPLAHVRDRRCLEGAKEARKEAARLWREHLHWRRAERFEGAKHHVVTRLAVDDIELPANRSDGRPLDVGHRPFGCLG